MICDATCLSVKTLVRQFPTAYVFVPLTSRSPQGLWFANPGGSNSMPSRTHSSVQRTRSLPVHTTPQTMVMFQQAGKNGWRDVTDDLLIPHKWQALS